MVFFFLDKFFSDIRASDFPSRSMVERIFGLAATDMKDVSDPPAADASELEHQPNEWDRLVEELVKLIESNPTMEEFAVSLSKTILWHLQFYFYLVTNLISSLQEIRVRNQKA